MFMALILMRCTFFRYLFDGVLSSNAIFVATASVQLIYNDTFVVNSYVKRNVEFMFKVSKHPPQPYFQICSRPFNAL